MRKNVLQGLPFWIASVLTGLVAVGYAMLFDLAENIFHQLLEWKDWSVFIITPFCFLFAWLIVRLFAANARGSGIPQVMASIELATPKHNHLIKKLLSLRIIIAKIASSLIMVLGGGAVGREGPTIQIAGSIFSIVHRIIPTSWPRLSLQSFILTGAAAGLAAAFNTPLGGVVFAMEELAKIHIRFFRTALFSAVIIAGLTAQSLFGSYLYLGYPDVKNLPFLIFFGVAATAIASGILGSLMSKAILAILKWKRKFSTAKSLVFLMASGLAIASIAYFLNAEVMGSGKDLMNRTLFTPDKHEEWDTVFLRVLGPILSFTTGSAGGIFAPSLAAGASVGAWASHLFEVSGANANILILSGMVGFLTGVTRTPFTSAILVLEMTDRHSVIFHLMLAAMISNMVSLLIDRKSFYEHQKQSFLESALQEEQPSKRSN